ncbi:MAG: Txe/YoeB family addiction module toxin [Bacteroidales bacterium]|nr:Txe/YoeB family addiction module toxin [Bacteroidales bacterium]
MNYRIALLPQAEEDLAYWLQTDLRTVVRIKRLLKDISDHPYSGLGKPEPLKWTLSGKWSRRINRKDRIIYKVDGDRVLVFVLAMRYHYEP